MRHQRWGTLAGILAAVVIVLVSVQLALAQEGQPPSVQPADVGAQAVQVIWDQLYPPSTDNNYLLTVPSYVEPTTPQQSGLMADDFLTPVVMSETEPSSAWIVSQVVVQAFVDSVFPGNEQASICFYGEANNKPQSFGSCTTGVIAGIFVDVGQYRTVTYTLPAPAFLLADVRYWLSVQMTNVPPRGSEGQWNWRIRSTPLISGTQAFAAKVTSNFTGNVWAVGCTNQWQVQADASSSCSIAGGYPAWPVGHDLLFKLIGSPFFGEFVTGAYLPLFRR